ncbi:CDGSH iron-sulfur domain-containing protein 3, mitochondrial-like [Melanotaenia boesemani]|uniref:CDGSH iron-sulfur domain-containing protein 3, mitochondrial-like n=1 Tax=Melanotaenia boesemani TaxID=1250792 RepID=UPI001C05847B|nr:CDGSH iron-sulfur domain-containing protein 3, mitochondrial-like [Melanotaenia boesemani]
MSAVRLMSAVWRSCPQTIRPPRLLPLVSASAVQFRLQTTQPVSAARLPCRVKVSAGKRYAWCACGHSQKQPFCDGAHRTKSPSISPLRFTPDRDRTLMLCAYCPSSAKNAAGTEHELSHVY